MTYTANWSGRLVAIAAGQPGAFERAVAEVRSGRIALLYENTLAKALRPEDLRYFGEIEHRRYKAYTSDEAARQFLVGRRIVKEFHAVWLSCSPREIAVSAVAHEKPHILVRTGLNTHHLPFFNISHSAEWVVMAIDAKHPVGIDIELSTAIDPDCPHSLRHIFMADEIAHIAGAKDPAARLDRFRRLWRAKEAVMKASGLGFVLQPNTFSVLEPDSSIKRMVLADGTAWRLDHISLPNVVTVACAWAFGCPFDGLGRAAASSRLRRSG